MDWIKSKHVRVLDRGPFEMAQGGSRERSLDAETTFLHFAGLAGGLQFLKSRISWSGVSFVSTCGGEPFAEVACAFGWCVEFFGVVCLCVACFPPLVNIVPKLNDCIDCVATDVQFCSWRILVICVKACS